LYAFFGHKQNENSKCHSEVKYADSYLNIFFISSQTTTYILQSVYFYWCNTVPSNSHSESFWWTSAGTNDLLS